MTIRIAIGMLTISACGMATAQSNLTLYGIVDEFVQVVNTGSGYTSAMGASGQWASRFGIKGMEDIGGGYSVQYVLENGFAPTTGSLATAGTLFNRQAWVGIATAWGQVRAGRQNSPLFIDEARMDAFGASTQASGLDNMTMFSPRTSNTISYQSPDLAGFRGGVFIGLGDQGGLRGTGASYQADLTFDKGPFSAFVAAQALKNTAGAPNDWTVLSGLSYAIGRVKVYGAYTREKWSDLLIDSSTYGVSVGYNINPFNYVALGWAQLTDYTSLGNSTRQLSGMYLYSLSKRTNVYAALSFLQNRGHAEYKLAGAANAGMQLAYPGADARGVQIGLVHRF